MLECMQVKRISIILLQGSVTSIGVDMHTNNNRVTLPLREQFHYSEELEEFLKLECKTCCLL